jgi:hypothetical protein
MVVHLMDRTTSLGWNSQLGNSGDELLEGILSQPPLTENVSLSTVKDPYFRVYVHGHECPEREAYFKISCDRSLDAAIKYVLG